MTSLDGIPAPSLLGVLGRPVALVSPGVVVWAALDADAPVQPRASWQDGPVWRWWVAAEDRWHRPEHEAAVRVTSPDGTPVIRTSMRVPGGDVRVVSFAAMVHGEAAVVLEVYNDSAGPVLFALVSEAVSMVGRRTRRLRGTRRAAPVHAVQFSRAPDDVVSAPSLGALTELLERHITSPEAVDPEPSDDARSSDLVGAATAHLFALSVGARLRAVVAARPTAGVVPSGDPSTPRAAPSSSIASRSGDPVVRTTSIPSAESVAAGWRRQIEQAARLDAPEEAAASRLLADRCHLLIDAGAQHPLVVRGLAAWGHCDAAVERLDTALSHLAAPVEAGLAAMLLDAAADAVAWSEDPARLVRALVETVGELAAWAGPGPAHDQARELRNHFAAAAAAEPGWQPWPPRPWTLDASGSGDGAPGGTAGGAVGCAGPTVAAAGRLLARRAEFLEEAAIGELVLLPGWQSAWRGKSIELHRLPTHLGRLSLALRWHGPRPALLWQLDQRPGTDRGDGPPPLLRCPLLDPDFAGRGWQGEALLS